MSNIVRKGSDIMITKKTLDIFVKYLLTETENQVIIDITWALF